MENTENQENKLKKDAIGIPQLIFFVISAVGPFTACLGTIPIMLEYGNGIGTAGMFIIAMAIWLLFAVGYSNMGRHVKNTGAFYAYISQGLGRVMGISASYMAVIGYTIIQVGMYGFFGYAVNNLLRMLFGVEYPWWIIAFLTIIVVTGLSYTSIDLGAKLLSFLMIIEVAMILLISISAILHPSSEGYTLAPYTLESISNGSPGIAIMFALGCFVGFETTAIFSEEAKNPEKSVPIATYISVIILGLMYSLASYAAVVGWGTNGITELMEHIYRNAENPGLVYIELTRRILGNTAAIVPSFIILSSIFTTLFSFQNMLARYYYAMARTGFMPKKFEIVHPKYKSPYRAVLLNTGITTIFTLFVTMLGWDPFNQVFSWLVGMGTLNLLILYTLTAIAIIAYFQKNKIDNRIWNTKIAPGLAAVGLGTAVILCIYNFPFFTGASPYIGIFMLLILIICFCISTARGLYIRKNHQDIYIHVGENIVS